MPACLPALTPALTRRHLLLLPATNAFTATEVLAFITAAFQLVVGVALVSNRRSFGQAQRELGGAAGWRAALAGMRRAVA